MSVRRSLLHLFCLLLLSAALPARADFARVGPTDTANGGYPAWYQDKTGLTLDFGQPLNQSELNGGWLLILPANLPTGAVPEVAFTNYSGEHFYWNASAGSKVQGGMSLTMSLEGAFAGGAPRAGDQIVFGRIRIKIASAPLTGNYKVYTPFGIFDFPGVTQGDKIFFTQDVGFTCGTNFACALDSSIGPFLLPSPYPGGREVPPIPDLVPGQDPAYDNLVIAGAATAYPGTGRKYIADPARLGPLTGGTCALTTPPNSPPQIGDCVKGNAVTDPKDNAGNFTVPARPVYVTTGGVLRDPNIFRVEVNGVALAPAPGTGTEHDFTTAGRVMNAPIASRITVDRASYSRSAADDKKLDVFVTAFPSMNPRLPGGAFSVSSFPDLGYYDTACAIDPATGKPTAPTTTGTTNVPVKYFQMFRDSPAGNTWWGQNAPLAIPSEVCVLDNSRLAPAYFPANVTDEVDILGATYSPVAGTLTIDAKSSDCFLNPDLTVDRYGPMVPGAAACTNTLTVSNVMAVPARVAVTSLRGGVASRDVRTGVGTPVLMNVVDPVADTFTMPEDCSPTAAADCVNPVVVDVLANDLYNGVAARSALAPGGGPLTLTVAISTPPSNGTATVDASNNLVYRPKPNFNGADLIGYKVTDSYSGTASAEGYLHITVTPVNDAPVAVNDTAGAPNGKAVTLNLLANDTDPDGAADLDAVVIKSLPAAGATLTCNGGAAVTIGTACAGGNVTFTGTGGGSVYTFTYSARDKALVQSANVATVTVTVNAAEAIVISKSIFTGKTWRWTVTGTDNVIAGQTVSISYDITSPPSFKVNGTCTPMTAATNPVIGTAVVDALGNWSFDTSVTSAGTVNPTNSGSNGTGFWCSPPKSVRVTSPLGASQSSVISFK